MTVFNTILVIMNDGLNLIGIDFFYRWYLKVLDLWFYNVYVYKLQVEYSFEWTIFYDYILLNFTHEAYSNIPQFLSYKDLFPQWLELSPVFTVQSLQRYTIPCIWVGSCWTVYHFLLLSCGCLGFDTQVILQYKLGHEVLAGSFASDLNCVT